MFRLIYNIFIFVYPKLIALASLRNPKAKLWIDGRKDVFHTLKNKFQLNTQKVIWMHCASLGEFEQGRPVLEALRLKYPDHKMLLTFFSPSGYEIRKDYDGVDLVCYLPMDSKANAQKFFEIVNPSMVIFVKYEFWYYYLKEANSRNITTVLISAIFSPQQIFFKWYGSIHREMLTFFTFIAVQNQESFNLLRGIKGIEDVFISGDTRFDRVLNIADKSLNISHIEKYINNRKVIIAGSTWAEDDRVIKEISNHIEKFVYIIAPHDIGTKRLQECLQYYHSSQLYSNWITNPDPKTKVLIIDNIGMLSSLYKYATIAIIGGGWGKEGIHNILEAAVYYKPVVFGPVYDKYFEAKEIIEEGGGFSVDNLFQLKDLLHKLNNDPIFYKSTAEKAGNFVLNHAGATPKIINKIETLSYPHK